MSKEIENNKKPSQMDATWKQALQHYLKDFFELCWQEAYLDIDWDKKFQFLEEELHIIDLGEKIGKRVVDKLISVCLKNGQEQWCLIHVEIESSNKTNFPERMYVYDAKIYEKYGKNIASMAILIDKDKGWRPGPYRRSLWGSETVRKYDSIKILDYRDRKLELLEHKNPFALIILWQLAAIETHNDPQARLFEKTKLTRMLYMHGKSSHDIRLMYRFLDGLLALNTILAKQYHESVKQIEQELKVDYMTTAEKIGFENGFENGFEKGLEQRLEKGESNMLLRQLEARFGTVPEEYLKQINQAKSEALLQWGLNFIDAKSFEDVFKH